MMTGMLIMVRAAAVAGNTRAQQSPIFMAILMLVGVGYSSCIMGLWAFVVFRILAWRLY
jgi:hypothetical protein